MSTKPKTKAKTIDDYLAKVSNDQRGALERLPRPLPLAPPLPASRAGLVALSNSLRMSANDLSSAASFCS